MNKRLISLLLIISVLMTVFSIPEVGAETRASNYISSYYATLSPGSSTGQLKIFYSVTAGVSGVTQIGVLSMFVYKPDGSIARTIVGSTANELLKTSGTSVSGIYTVSVDPGITYYCKVTFKVKNASGSEICDYTTNTAVAPN